MDDIIIYYPGGATAEFHSFPGPLALPGAQNVYPVLLPEPDYGVVFGQGDASQTEAHDRKVLHSPSRFFKTSDPVRHVLLLLACCPCNPAGEFYHAPQSQAKGSEIATESFGNSLLADIGSLGGLTPRHPRPGWGQHGTAIVPGWVAWLVGSILLNYP